VKEVAYELLVLAVDFVLMNRAEGYCYPADGGVVSFVDVFSADNAFDLAHSHVIPFCMLMPTIPTLQGNNYVLKVRFIKFQYCSRRNAWLQQPPTR